MSTEPDPKPAQSNPVVTGAAQPPASTTTGTPRPAAAPGKAAAPVRRYVAPPSTGKRDMLVIVGVALALLILILVGIYGMSKVPTQRSRNMMTGTITAKNYSGERTEEVSVSRKGVQSSETDSGYSFTVRSEPEGKEYELPVSKVQYDTKKVGDKQDFIRPPSEQR